MNQDSRAVLGDIPSALASLLRAELDFGRNMVEALTGRRLPDVRGLAGSLARRVQSSCAVPPPCWMPQPLGECVSHAAPCKVARLRLIVHNCDRRERTIRIGATGDGTGLTVSSKALSLGPMERGTFELQRRIPDDATNGTRYDTTIWVEGCKMHYLRWTTSVGTLGFDSCHEVPVEDCPDYMHHWYDHFYCARPCFYGRRGTG